LSFMVKVASLVHAAPFIATLYNHSSTTGHVNEQRYWDFAAKYGN
jgi:hypothetical protein